MFPLELAEKVIRYYSFKHDVVLDPFAGTGTTGVAASHLGRRFVMYEKDKEYVELMKSSFENLFDLDIEWKNIEDKPINLFK